MIHHPISDQPRLVHSRFRVPGKSRRVQGFLRPRVQTGTTPLFPILSSKENY